METTPLQRYVDFLARRRRRPGRYAGMVIDAAWALPGTFSSEELANRLRGQVSRATVYRVLANLVGAGLICRVRFNGQVVLVVVASHEGEGQQESSPAE